MIILHERTLAITSCVESAVIISELSPRSVGSWSQNGDGYVHYLGQTETPRREEWSVSSLSFPGVVVPFQCLWPMSSSLYVSES